MGIADHYAAYPTVTIQQNAYLAGDFVRNFSEPPRRFR
jgi:hypothetical protein